MVYLSICCITYNHEKYITQTIEGFLKQKTNFEFEIIIGEDKSNDKTRSIIKEYVNRSHQKIKLITSEKNIGMIPNFIRTIEQCSGKYIAFCEGDDYWTDPRKLQRQVDFLEANPDYSVCFHKVNILNNGQIQDDFLTNVPAETTSIKDLAYSNYIHTPSLVVRNIFRGNYPQWLIPLPIGDYPFTLLHAQSGKIKYFPEAMAVYRYQVNSMWAMQNKLNKVEKTIQTYSELSKHFSLKIQTILQFKLISGYRFKASLLFANKQFVQFFNTIIKALIIVLKNPLVLWYIIKHFLSKNDR